ncbi:MAG: NAD(P)-binding domain-containing protein [Anaerolineae bacterium]|nr:NAD(P)-binding domain-containing protein [Anaerolineae bacterium]
MIRDTSARVCVIGAGPSGITAGKNLLQAGLRNIVIYEKGDQVGGNWVYSPRLSHSSVFDTTHIISSKALSQYDDYPMPADYPDYPSHKQLLAYFQGYATHFGVAPYIRFNTEVRKAEKQPDETWAITLGNGTVEKFDYLLVANGHHWNPRLPSYRGEFTGQLLHSHDFKSAEPFKNQRVLVIGGGNSACDIAVETSRVSAFTAISMRRGYYIAPKFTMGMPTDVMNARIVGLPDFIRVALLRFSLWLNVGDYAHYGLERPQHGPLQQHATMNSELLYFIRHGKVHPRKDIERFEGRTVHFVDGKAEDYDAVIAATGFVITFPFFDKDFIDFSEGDVPLYLRVFHPDHPSLFFIGLVQPLGCVWPLADLHAKLAANAIIGHYTPPADMRDQITAEVEGRKRQFIKAARHTIEVEYHKHLWALQREIPASAPAWPKESLPSMTKTAS